MIKKKWKKQLDISMMHCCFELLGMILMEKGKKTYSIFGDSQIAPFGAHGYGGYH